MQQVHTEDPQILGTTEQNLVTMATWNPGLVNACITVLHTLYISQSRNA